LRSNASSISCEACKTRAPGVDADSH
jgi:hypothetical protein